LADFVKRLLILLFIGSVMTMLIVMASWAISKNHPNVPTALDYGISSLKSTGGTIRIAEYNSPTEQFHYWTDEKNGVITAYLFDVNTLGYAGPIRLLVSVDTLGDIVAIWNVAHSENAPHKEFLCTPTVRCGSDYLMGKSLSILKPIIVEARFGSREILPKEVEKLLRENNSVAAVSGATSTTKAIAALLSSQVRYCFMKVKGLAQ
jgi:hypothetical protein